MFVAKTYIFNRSYFIKFLCIAINFINIIASRLEEPLSNHLAQPLDH